MTVVTNKTIVWSEPGLIFSSSCHFKPLTFFFSIVKHKTRYSFFVRIFHSSQYVRFYHRAEPFHSMSIWPSRCRYGFIFHCGPDNRARNSSAYMRYEMDGDRIMEDDQIFPFTLLIVCLASYREKLAARIRQQISDPF